jgi:hypothetical protein
VLQHDCVRKEDVSGPMNLKMRDKCRVARKGRLIFKVYIPDKPERCGIKAYLVCESKSAYISNMEVYTGKSRPVKSLVLKLVGAQLLNTGYYMYQDTYYNMLN